LNPKCKRCSKHGDITPEGKIRCITKKGTSDKVQIQEFSVPDASACAEKTFNIPLGKEDRQHYETVFKEKDNAIGLLTIQKDNAIAQHEKDHEKVQSYMGIEKELQGEKKKNKILERELEHMPDIVLERDDLRSKYSSLQEKLTEAEAQATELSHDPLTEKYKELLGRYEQDEQLLKDQGIKHTEETEQMKGEIEKLEALVKIQKDKKTEILFTVEKTLRDFKQFLPETSSSSDQYLNTFKWKEYTQNTLKVIQSLEGYLQTIAR
jgi:hypothetical protein